MLDAQIAYNELGGYCVPTSSLERPSAQRILRGGVWEPETLALVADACGQGDIVHAGTYFGDFLPAYSRAVTAGARVWAFEPNAENFRCAQITVLLNGLANVTLANAGLGAQSGVGTLRVADGSGVALGGGSRLVTGAPVGAGSGTQETDIVSIDDVVPPDRTVGVIQLDVEGFEDEALRGARATITRDRPTLIIERTPSDEILDELLRPLGYTVTRRVHMNTVLTCEPGLLAP
ncbi:MAG: FkbM family methyltransferase [Acidimicrobiia bacterium]